MINRAVPAVFVSWVFALLLFAIAVAPQNCTAGGVTIITHGLNGNVDGWVTGMATNIPNYRSYQGTNFTIYKMYFYFSSGSYFLAAMRDSGDDPATLQSGEIIVKLDWSQLSDGNSYNTYQVASFVVPALLTTNFIPELGGHALAEFPMHLIGHSRGGSLICEMSRLLGTNGIWVDHVTTLDPHPLNDSAFPFDGLLYSAVDAPARTYSNVLFHDNYWENINSFVHGEAVSGAYVRKLTNLNGGYSDPTSGSHSDVHLWYHGTLDWRVPTSDNEASITSSERTNWWSTYEQAGHVAGFLYSLIGGGNRLSGDMPLGPNTPAIRNGFNQWWDLGAGASPTNRTALTNNNGSWPNVIRLNRTETNDIAQGQSTPLRIYYQWAKPASSNATIAIYLDDDLNPLNTNQFLLKQIVVPVTSASNISYFTTNIVLAATNAAPGYHAFVAKITGGGQSRYLYAPEPVRVLANQQPPVLDIASTPGSQFLVGVNGSPGQTVVLQSSFDLQGWQSVITNTLATNRWVYTNTQPPDVNAQFFRAVLSQ